MKEKIRYYNSFSDDFAKNKNQNYALPENYKWLKIDILSLVLRKILYGAALVFSGIYLKLFFSMKTVKNKSLKKYKKTGIFVYGNHTLEIGDVFIPAFAVFPKGIYTVVSSANLGLPVIGKILPCLGALPLPEKAKEMVEFLNAMEYRLQKNKAVVIYPEAHVWNYYNEIRPFDSTSFRYPVKFNKPVFCTTVTYQKRKFGKRPKITVYVDGPFFAKESSSKKIMAEDLKNQVAECMKKRSKQSNTEYIIYKSKNR